MRLVITDDFLKSSIASALVIASVAAHFTAFKKTDPDDTKGSFDSQSNNCPLDSADLETDVKLFIDRGEGNEEE